jgi:ureidoacrylate peracid hydrolase
MAKFNIHPERTALLIIDMQNAFLKPGCRMALAAGRELIPKLKELMHACRTKTIPVIFAKHILREDGSDEGIASEFPPGKICLTGSEEINIYDELQPEEGDIIVEKRRYSAFFSTDLDLVLRCKGIDTLIIGGVVTHMCCDTTARDARMRDYKVIFLSDGTATYNIPDMGWGPISAEEVQKFVLTILASRYAQVTSIGDVLNQLRRVNL